MSENWVADIGDMHLKFGVNTWQYENKNNTDRIIFQEKYNKDLEILDTHIFSKFSISRFL